MIEVCNLTKNYGSAKAIDNISFRVEKGEVLGLLGPNAAGKTTTMRIITCYIPASSGSAKVAGFDVYNDSYEIKKRIGYLPETPPLYSEMTVQSFLDFVAKIKGIEFGNRKKMIFKAIEKTGLEANRKTLIKNLSKGYKQRLGIAQAIIHEPEILILDEPTIGLDPKQIIEVRELIRDLAGKHTVILSTHILPEVSMTCDRVLIIDRGRVVAEDNPENLTAKFQGSEQIIVKIGGLESVITEYFDQIQGILSVKVNKRHSKDIISYTLNCTLDKEVAPKIAKQIIENGWDLYELKKSEMSLEEIFLRLTTSEKEVYN